MENGGQILRTFALLLKITRSLNRFLKKRPQNQSQFDQPSRTGLLIASTKVWDLEEVLKL